MKRAARERDILWPRVFIRLGPGRGLPGQVALVAAGNHGIGRAMAEMLAGAGGNLVLNHMGVTAGIVEQVSRPGSPLLVDRNRGAGLLALAVDSFGRRYWPMRSEPGIVTSPEWPPRSPSRAIFYAALNENYATTIARDWNAPASVLDLRRPPVRRTEVKTCKIS